MALTNFALLTDEQKTVWSMDLWKHARNYAFVNKFLGKDSNSLIQHEIGRASCRERVSSPV